MFDIEYGIIYPLTLDRHPSMYQQSHYLLLPSIRMTNGRDKSILESREAIDQIFMLLSLQANKSYAVIKHFLKYKNDLSFNAYFLSSLVQQLCQSCSLRLN